MYRARFVGEIDICKERESNPKAYKIKISAIASCPPRLLTGALWAYLDTATQVLGRKSDRMDIFH